MTWSKIKAQKEVDKSDPKAVFSEMKSKSFWSWHDTGMKGPENVHQRLRMQKKMVKDKAPLDVSESGNIWPLIHSIFLGDWKASSFCSGRSVSEARLEPP